MYRAAAQIPALALAVVLALPAAAEESGIEAVISDQLSAFNARDVERAWTHASPMIQGMFGTPENFGRMVRQGYPMVWSNSDARFLERREMAGSLYQRVMVRGPDGSLWILAYEMIEVDGVWRIDGVAILPAPDVGV